MRTRAAVSYTFCEPLIVEEVELAPPRQDQVHVRIGAVAICHSDISYIDELWGGRLPAVWGHEAAGVVVATGSAVDDVRVGDNVAVTLVRACGACGQCNTSRSVACTGVFDDVSPLRTMSGEVITQGMNTAAFAEDVVVHVSQVVPLPDGLSFGAGALLACGAVTGFGAVANTAGVESGSSVVVIGTGGVGLHAVQAAVAVEASPIIAVDLNRIKLDWASRLGATHTIDPSRADVGRAVAAATGGRGADYVVVTTGSAAVLDSSHDLLAPGGALVLVGLPPTGVTMALDVAGLASANQRVLGSKLGTTTIRTDVPLLADRYLRGLHELDGLISGRFAFDQINRAIEAARRSESIRIVIDFGGAT